MIDVSFIKEMDLGNGTEMVCLLVNSDLMLSSSTVTLDANCGNLISKTLQHSRDFAGKFGQTKSLSVVGPEDTLLDILLVGVGEESKLQLYQIEELGGIIWKIIEKSEIASALIMVDHEISEHEKSKVAAVIASGMLLRSYQFNEYKTQELENKCQIHCKVAFCLEKDEQAKECFRYFEAVSQGVYFARDWTNRPSNYKTPTKYAAAIEEALKELNVEVQIMGERELLNLGMEALVGVGQGSQNESKLVVAKYQGLDEDSAPIALVGKGVTFDSGGISLKPSMGMFEMKSDMAGSAAVIGTVMALALRKAKVNVVGVVALAENMPGGNAQKPGDVVKTISGKTIEVIDTDAEGRLVLADALCYTQDKFNPECIIDLATLTGAISVALGNTYAGCFCNKADLSQKLIQSAEKVNEKLWSMPLHKDYLRLMKSSVADIANLSISMRGLAGSSTAANFLEYFIKDTTAWAHLDIAGTAWSKQEGEIYSRGSVGFGVRLLNQFIKDHYEEGN